MSGSAAAALAAKSGQYSPPELPSARLYRGSDGHSEASPGDKPERNIVHEDSRDYADPGANCDSNADRRHLVPTVTLSHSATVAGAWMSRGN